MEKIYNSNNYTIEVLYHIGAYENSIHFIFDEETKTCAIVDPAWEPDLFLKKIEDKGYTLTDIWITHWHGDHTNAVDDLANKTGAKITAGINEVPYLNIENNAGFAGGDGLDMDFVGSTTDFHIGVEGSGEDTSWYLQAGPALISPDNDEASVEFSGKIGGAVAITADKNLNLYGEVSFITVDDFYAANVGTKIGMKYNF